MLRNNDASFDSKKDAAFFHYGVATIRRLLKISVSFAKEPYKRDDILQKRPIISRSLLIVATSYQDALEIVEAY